jgi:DNA-binding MarR family transcriptional regulator
MRVNETAHLFMSRSPKLDVCDCNCNALRRAARRVSNFYDAELAPSGLKVTQFIILATLSRLGEASVNVLAENLDLDRTTTGRNLLPLEKAGLINVESSASDGRLRTITLSRKGSEKLKETLPLWRRAQSKFENDNGPGKTAVLRKMLAELKIKN